MNADGAPTNSHQILQNRAQNNNCSGESQGQPRQLQHIYNN